MPVPVSYTHLDVYKRQPLLQVRRHLHQQQLRQPHYHPNPLHNHNKQQLSLLQQGNRNLRVFKEKYNHHTIVVIEKDQIKIDVVALIREKSKFQNLISISNLVMLSLPRKLLILLMNMLNLLPMMFLVLFMLMMVKRLP